jgi:hypothetical protein
LSNQVLIEFFIVNRLKKRETLTTGKNCENYFHIECLIRLRVVRLFTTTIP